MRRFETGPDFIGIGVQRAGTSWLYQCLLEHPQIFMPRKEFHFFDRQHEKGINWYVQQFEGSEKDQLRGEYTPDYLSSSSAIQRIHEYNPERKLLIVLRNPFERAYSGYRLFQSHGHLGGKSFKEALCAQPELLQKSLYSGQLDLLFKYFPRDQVFIGMFEDVARNPSAFFASVCSFLGINEGVRPQALGTIKNASGFASLQAKYRLPALQKAISRSRFRKLVEPAKNSRSLQAVKRGLIRLSRNRTDIYAVDAHTQQALISEIAELEGRLGINCSHWRDSAMIED